MVVVHGVGQWHCQSEEMVAILKNAKGAGKELLKESSVLSKAPPFEFCCTEQLHNPCRCMLRNVVGYSLSDQLTLVQCLLNISNNG